MAVVVGSLDAVDDGWARGWAQQPGDSLRPQRIEVWVDDELAAEGVADAFRADLLQAGIGDGRVAFEIPLPSRLRDGQPHRVEAREGTSAVVLAGSPRTMVWQPPFTARDFDARAPWIDHANYAEEIDRRLSAGSLDPSEAELLSRWHEEGVVVLPAAVDAALIDRLWSDVDRAWRERPSVRINVLGAGERDLAEVGERDALPSTTYRIMNFHDVSAAAVEIVLQPKLVRFLSLIFDARPVGMQTLVFEYGSEQRGHMDFAYVHTRNPACLAAAWVACEDVSPDAGPLFYYVASHRLIPKYDFGDGNVLAFGAGSHTTAFEDYLEDSAVRLGLERRVYCPRKGDVLVWHSALVHGGSPRLNPHQTRRSLVAHYSTEAAYPEDSRRPGRPPTVIERNGGVYYSRETTIDAGARQDLG